MMTSSRSRTARAAAGALAAAAVRRAGWGHASAPAAGGHTANMTTPRTGGAGCPRDCPPGGLAAASARPRDPGWGRAPPASRGARSLSIRVCRLCVLTGPHLRPIGERRLEAITPQGADHGADRQSGCPRPRPQSQAPMPNANRAHRPQTTDHRLLFYNSFILLFELEIPRSTVTRVCARFWSARDFDLGGGFQHSGSYPLVFQHSSGCHERAGTPGRPRPARPAHPRGVDPAPPAARSTSAPGRADTAHTRSRLASRVGLSRGLDGGLE